MSIKRRNSNAGSCYVGGVERAEVPSEKKKACGDSADEWVRAALGFAPDAMQARMLNAVAKRGVLNCTRQWGKLTVTAAKAMHEAVSRKGSLTIVVSPSARQSGELV